MESRVAHHIPGGASSILTQPLLEGRGPYGRLQQQQPQQPLTIYPIDQIRLSHLENDYIDSPSVVSQQPPSHKGASRRSNWLGHSQEAFSGGGNHNHQQQQQARCEGTPFSHQDATTHPWISFSGRPSSVSSSSSTSSDQRLLDHAAPHPTVDQQPTPGCFMSSTSTSKVLTSSTPCSTSSSTSSKAKVLTSSTCSSSSSTSSSTKDSNKTAKVASSHQRVPLPLPLLPSSPAEKKHLLLCEHCGRCRCSECTLPRPLPSCWVCNQEWLCSAQSLVDSATCMCLVRGVFYHCAADDQDDNEGSCAERPCSCSGAHCCARWSFMAALSLLLPCLLCYLPAAGATLLGQRCYDGLSRPGCRCKSSSQGGSGGGFLLLRGGTKGGALEKQQQQREGA